MFKEPPVDVDLRIHKFLERKSRLYPDLGLENGRN